MPGKIKVNIRKKQLDIKLTKLIDLDIDYIAHISDIHIRPLARHAEFKAVFEHVYKKLRELKSVKPRLIIVVTGDIYDHKTLFKPETFDMCRNLLRSLSEIAQTFVIAGNHDMIEGNTTRMDSVSPISEDIDNLFYLKWTGLYDIGNIVFAVSSLYDEKFIKHCEIPELVGKKVIALYHGTRPLQDFIGYYAALLGDIHKHHMLSDVVGYAGSLIQQDYSEPIHGH